MTILSGRPAQLDWVDSPAVERKLKHAVEHAWWLAGQPDSEPSARTDAVLELIELLLRQAENRCAVCGAPTDRGAGTWCSESCYKADEEFQESNDDEE